MTQKAIVSCEAQSIELLDVVLPDIGEKDVRIDTKFSGISIGTEKNLIREKVSWGEFPICTGYQAVGVVEQVGDEVDEYDTGDAVYFGMSERFTTEDGVEVSPTTGTHCSAAVVNIEESVVGHLPADVDHAAASLFVMPAVGLNGVSKSNVQLGDTVAVHGVGLVGLGVVAAASHRGAEIIAIDLQQRRLQIAKQLGADHLINAEEEDIEGSVSDISPGGTDVVFEATGIPSCIDIAARLCKDEGKFVFQGDYGEEPITFRERSLNERHVNGFFPAGYSGDDGAQAVLKNMAAGALPWERAITNSLLPSEAPEVYDRLLEGEYEDDLGIVINWSEV